jgi:hypothetical protein
VPGKLEPGGTAAVGQEAKLPNAHESAGQHMLQEAPQKLCGRESHRPLLVAVRVVLPAEGDAFTVEGQQTMIADGNTVGVPAQITQHLRSAAEGELRIYNPVFPEQSTKESPKVPGLSKRCAGWRKLQLVPAKGALEAVHELTSKHPAEGFDR